MSNRLVFVVVAAGTLLAGCATDPNRVPPSQQRWVAQGAPVSCISTRNIRSTNIVDDRTINFVMSSRSMFRNELPFSCPGLSFNRAFKYNSRTPQLCSVDTITVIQGGNMRGATCGLGRFQPMVPVPATPVP